MAQQPAVSARLRAGIIGGGHGAFIGAVHRIAAELDAQATVVAGAMSADPQTARDSAAAWNLARSYDSYQEMARAEVALRDGIDFVIIATPNHLHLPMARAFLEAGIHVVCDKPLTATLAQGEELLQLVLQGKALFALTHNYTGYAAVKQARSMIRDGLIGEVRKVLVEYQQDWLMHPVEHSGNKQAVWRTDPERAGPSGCLGDIGTHAENLLQYITGLSIQALCADLSSFVAGRRLEDDASLLLRLEGGAKGTMVCSQIACGEENNLSIRIYGTRAGLEWHQQEPNTLLHKPAGEPWRIVRSAHGYLDAAARAATRTPAGHPEGYLDAFANLYRAFIADVLQVRAGQAPRGGYPTAQDGVRGLRFIAAALESARRGSQWVNV
jgi:predicted dehydrogenase